MIDNTLRANQKSDNNTRLDGIWAKNVVIPEYEFIKGSNLIGAYVVYVIKIELITGGLIKLCKRYSEFDLLRQRLVEEYPSRIKEIPELPPKTVITRFRPDFLEKRRHLLQYFLMCIVLNPAFATGELVRRFLRVSDERMRSEYL